MELPWAPAEARSGRQVGAKPCAPRLGKIRGSSAAFHQHRLGLLHHLGSFHTSLYTHPGRREGIPPAAELPPSASNTSLPHSGSLVQNSSKEMSGKHGSTIVPPTPPHVLSLCQGFPGWEIRLLRGDHHRCPGKGSGACALQEMPEGKGLPCLAPDTATWRDTSKVWEVPPALCLPQLSPSSPGSFPANPFCRPASPGPKFREKLTPELLGPWQPLFLTPDRQC